MATISRERGEIYNPEKLQNTLSAQFYKPDSVLMGFPDTFTDNAHKKSSVVLKNILATHILHTQKNYIKVMHMLTKLTVVIVLQYIHISIMKLYTLNIHNIICQLYLKKVRRKEKKSSMSIPGNNEMVGKKKTRMHYCLRGM